MKTGAIVKGNEEQPILLCSLAPRQAAVRVGGGNSLGRVYGVAASGRGERIDGQPDVPGVQDLQIGARS